MNYDELVEALKCELTERRWALVKKAFDMLDPNSTGMYVLHLVAGLYCSHQRFAALPRLSEKANIYLTRSSIVFLVVQDICGHAR